MARYRATLAYDGSAYLGFQRQAEGMPTIQAAVEEAIQTATQQTASVLAAGRTDSGVHASGQVIAFEIDWRHGTEALKKALNINLPRDIAVQDIRQQEGFHPRFDARSRTYEYRVLVAATRQPLLWHRTWQIERPLDFQAMQKSAKLLIGEHDFAAFGNPPQGENTFRRVFRSEWVREDATGMHIYTIEATAFLHHMVRRIVGLLVNVGRTYLTVDEFEHIFRSADLSRSKVLAPPQGLVFANVRYDDKLEDY